MPYYVLTSAPMMEFKAESALRAMGYKVVMPYEERELRKRAGRDRRGEFRRFVLMRRYLVVEAANSDEVGTIVYRMAYAPKRLITGYLGTYGQPTPVPAGAVEYLNSLSGRRILQPGQIATLRVGDIARIVNGPMEGQEAQITGIKRDQARMFLKWLNGEREVTVPIRNLQRVLDASAANQVAV